MDVGVLGAGILNGAIAGAGYGFSGWMVLGHDEAFDGPKFLRAVLWGTLVGIFAVFTGMPLATTDTMAHDQLSDLGILAMASGFLDQFTVWLWARIKGKKPWKGGPTVEEIAPKAVSGLGEALKERVDATPTPPGIVPPASNASVMSQYWPLPGLDSAAGNYPVPIQFTLQP